MTAAWIAGAAALVLSWLGTRRALASALSSQVLAVPNERSSHTRPTPTGGGVGLGVAMFTVMALAAIAGVRDLELPLLAAAIACFCGYVDDVRTLRALAKMAVMTAAGLLLAVGDPLGAVTLPTGQTLDLGLLAIPLTLFWLSGFTNAFNFMDGIDGIAALTAIVSGVAYAVAGTLAGDATLAVVGAVTAGAALGFLPWNFPRARIFMGDAGSLPLGLLLAHCAVLADASGAVPFPASILLLGPFVFDATFTLVRRALRGERVWRAHREHLYQRLSRLWGGHPRVSLLYAAFAAGTAVAALLYRDLGSTGRLLSLGGPLAAMLAFSALVLAADRRAGTRAAAAPEAASLPREEAPTGSEP